MPYTLSNAQQKELLVRGQPLLIALPLPRSDPETNARALAEARRLLVLPEGVRIVSAEVDEVWVQAPERHPWPAESLTQWLGPIVGEAALGQVPAETLIVRHVAILALVRGPADRHPLTSPQWPNGALR